MNEAHLAALFERVDWWLAGAFCAGALLASLVWAWRLKAHAAARSEHVGRLEGRLESLSGELQRQRHALHESHAILTQRLASEAALAARLEESRQAVAEKERLFREQGEALKQEFELLANRIFERQGERHQVRLEAGLATVLNPLRDQLNDFRNRVETVYDSETRDRASLLTEVRNLQSASDRINREAENLTRALKGDVKAQGNWGELVLERVLEASGLRAGHEYHLQAARRDGDGGLKRPDVLIRLPDDKDVVVDAKLSLLAYEQAQNTQEESLRGEALRAHVASVRGHVRRLAEQDYDRLDGVRSLDFVLLFVPIEAAFSAAMEQDPRLFSEAFEKRIVIVSPTTLMMTLRIIHNVWRYEKQSRNAEEIARRAGALYDKLRGFVEDMETLGRQLETTERTYRAAFGKLSTGKGNLIRQAEQFRELGAPVKKAFGRNLVGDARASEN